MLTISVKTNIDDTIRRVQGAAKQMPFAAAKAINAVGNIAALNIRREIIDVFDRPKPYTVNAAALLVRANKQTLTATVGLKTESFKGGMPASKYLLASVKGGFRRTKRFEKALQAVGVLPPGMVAVAGKAATMDAYGNVSAGQINQILAYFKANRDATQNTTDRARTSRWKTTKRKPVGYKYFVGRPGDGKLPLGIWMVRRHAALRGTEIKPILIFVDGAVYERIFELGYVVEQTIKRSFNAEFTKALAAALATAR